MSNIPDMPNELKEIGTPGWLWQDWYQVSNYLWNIAKKNFDEVGNEDNAIQIGNWEVGAYFVNDRYIEVRVTEGDTERLVVRYQDNLKQLTVSVFAILCDGSQCLHNS